MAKTDTDNTKLMGKPLELKVTGYCANCHAPLYQTHGELTDDDVCDECEEMAGEFLTRLIKHYQKRLT